MVDTTPPVVREAEDGRELEALVGRGAHQHPQPPSPMRPSTFVLRGLVIAAPAIVVVALWRTMTAPLWFNEQWRAFFISYRGGWIQAIRADHLAALAVGWFAIERWSVELFGSTELVLRMPEAVAFVASCALLFELARRYVADIPAAVIALVGGMGANLVSYGTQLGPYDVDLATILAVLLVWEWLHAGTARRTWPAIAAGYAVIGVLCVVGSATVFAAAPPLAWDAVRALRGRWPRWTLAAIGTAGAFAVINVVVEARESPPGEYSYWKPTLPSHHGLATTVRYYVDGLRDLVTGGLARSDLLGPVAHDVLVAVWVVLLVVGAFTLLRRRPASGVLIALIGSLALTAVAAALGRWPFGLVRLNFYEVPLLVLLAGIGAGAGIGRRNRPARHARKDRATAVRRFAWWFGVGAALTGLIMAGVGLAYESTSIDQTYRAQPAVAYGDRIVRAVEATRRAATPTAAVVVDGVMARDGWLYYSFEAPSSSWQGGPGVPRSRTLLVDRASTGITRFLNRRRPGLVFLYVAYGLTAAEVRGALFRMSDAGYCEQVRSQNFAVSGLLVTVRHGGCT